MVTYIIVLLSHFGKVKLRVLFTLININQFLTHSCPKSSCFKPQCPYFSAIFQVKSLPSNRGKGETSFVRANYTCIRSEIQAQVMQKTELWTKPVSIKKSLAVFFCFQTALSSQSPLRKSAIKREPSHQAGVWGIPAQPGTYPKGISLPTSCSLGTSELGSPWWYLHIPDQATLQS